MPNEVPEIVEEMSRPENIYEELGTIHNGMSVLLGSTDVVSESFVNNLPASVPAKNINNRSQS